MISDEVLELAVRRGIVSADQAGALRALAREPNVAGVREPQDDERLRFISGFGDVFVTIGLGLFLGSAAYFIYQAVGPLPMWAGLAVMSWLLAEFFTRVRRMALPSIVLLIVFALTSSFALATALGTGMAAARPFSSPRGPLGLFGLMFTEPMTVAGVALLTAGLVAAHYWRFRVPVTIAAGAAAVAAAVLAFVFALAPGPTVQTMNLLLLVCGLAIFALAMRFDMSDPRRLTRRTDIAFWLHLLAAPLIVHPLISGLLGGRGRADPETAVAILAVFLALAFVAVIIDRRAMLVSGLTYAGVAFSTLLRQSALADKTMPATLLALGAFVLLLSAGWRPLRRAILSALPSAFARRLPNPAASI
jgi:hypothetical protein